MRQQADPRPVASTAAGTGTLRDVLAGTVLATGWMCAVTTWSWLPLVSVTAVLVLTLSVTVLVLTEATLGPVRVVALATSATLWIVGATGLVTVLAWAGLLALLGVVASSTTARTLVPRVLRRRTTGARADRTPAWTPPWSPSPAPSVAAPVLPGPDVVVLDDEELCRAWRQSYVRLRGAASTATRLAIVRRRQEYLDELQLRHGEAFARWLATTTCASSDPLPYIRRESRRRRRRRSSRR
jgi:hypothetical protein